MKVDFFCTYILPVDELELFGFDGSDRTNDGGGGGAVG